MSEYAHSSDNGPAQPAPPWDLVPEPIRFGAIRVVQLRTAKGSYTALSCMPFATEFIGRLPPGEYSLEVKDMTLEEYHSIVAVQDPIRHLTE